MNSRSIAPDPSFADQATWDVGEIEPFPEFKLDVCQDVDLNRTFEQFDLWSNDSICASHRVYWLKPGKQFHPGALVSFPGSGNSWLRMLLMGITGILVDSVYKNENGSEGITNIKISLLYGILGKFVNLT